MYKKERLLILRQFVSKVNTMNFTMGTLTVFFIFSIISFSIAIIFHDYLSHQLEKKLTFDIILFSDDIKDSFNVELDLIKKNHKIKDYLVYHIYQNRTSQILVSIQNNSKKKLNQKGTNSKGNQSTYFTYDPIIKLSDYNHLRKMLGYDTIALKSNEYAIHLKKRLIKSVDKVAKKLRIYAKWTIIRIQKQVT